MSVTKKEIKNGSSGTFDRELIYSRVMGLAMHEQSTWKKSFSMN